MSIGWKKTLVLWTTCLMEIPITVCILWWHILASFNERGKVWRLMHVLTVDSFVRGGVSSPVAARLTRWHWLTGAPSTRARGTMPTSSQEWLWVSSPPACDTYQMTSSWLPLRWYFILFSYPKYLDNGDSDTHLITTVCMKNLSINVYKLLHQSTKM